MKTYKNKSCMIQVALALQSGGKRMAKRGGDDVLPGKWMLIAMAP